MTWTSSHLLAATLAAVMVGMIVPTPEANAADPQLAHAVFFTLKDRSPEARQKLVDACDKFLTGHRGAVSYTVGTIAEDVKEPGISDGEFDVALHVVFESKAMLAEYLKSPRHDQFVAAINGTMAKVRVFDSYLPAPKAASAGR